MNNGVVSIPQSLFNEVLEHLRHNNKVLASKCEKFAPCTTHTKVNIKIEEPPSWINVLPPWYSVDDVYGDVTPKSEVVIKCGGKRHFLEVLRRNPELVISKKPLVVFRTVSQHFQ